ncbi:hypothetical protein GUJ93_ZPchr0458g22510 [Zizania palustris]|uniref:Uncharacterized protein n=1 Tax=Zizania palustris TaxID=103762 RepID=A0A8J5RS34_ZIZPA|nr:hypothetical protein GUJ93_ZPchr0458g22510 [Zizania palustris]
MWPLLTQDQLDLTIDAESNFFCKLEGLQEEQLLLLKRSFKLRELRTDDIAGFLVKPICSFLSSSLTDLEFQGNSKQVERFTEEQEEAFQLLTSLQKTTNKGHCLRFVHSVSLVELGNPSMYCSPHEDLVQYPLPVHKSIC